MSNYTNRTQINSVFDSLNRVDDSSFSTGRTLYGNWLFDEPIVTFDSIKYLFDYKIIDETEINNISRVNSSFTDRKIPY